jgi:hypothetical protein
MPVDIDLDRAQRIVHSRAWGAVSDGDLLDHMSRIQELLTLGTTDPSWAHVYDLSEADMTLVSAGTVRRLAEGSPWPAGTVRVLIGPRDIQFGLARMYALLGGARTESVHVTRSADEAAAFIEQARSRWGSAASTGMGNRRGLVRMFVILAVFGLSSLFSMLSKPSFATIRAVDAVQLLGTGMCFGAAILALALFLRSPRPS